MNIVDILLGCDLRQAEIAALGKVLNGHPMWAELTKKAIEKEIEQTSDEDNLFKGATPYVFLMMEFFITTSHTYYAEAIAEVIEDLIQEAQSAPIACWSAFANIVVTHIVHSHTRVPSELKEVCAALYEYAYQKFPGISKAKSVGSYVLFRGFSSVILRPHVSGLIKQETVTPNARKALVQIARSLAYLSVDDVALPSEFAAGAEYMELLRVVNKKNCAAMASFLEKLVENNNTPKKIKSTPDEAARAKEFIKFIDVLLVRMKTSGIKSENLVQSHLTRVKEALEKSDNIDIDILRTRTDVGGVPLYSFNRAVSKVLLHPREEDRDDRIILDPKSTKLVDEIGFKVFFKDTICFFSLPKKKTNIKKLKSTLKKIFYDDLMIRYEDSEGDLVPLSKDEELEKYVDRCGGNTVKIHLINELSVVPKGNTNHPALQKMLLDIESRLRAQYPKQEFNRESFVISDPAQPDNPLVYVNDGFEKLTYYASEEILGQNCRFLQGRLSSVTQVARMSRAIKNGEEVQVELVNYRKDGKPFWNRFHIFPLKDDNGEISHFVAVQQDITHQKQRASNPKDWTLTDVMEWFEFLQAPQQACDKFVQLEIDGKALLKLDDADLEQMGIDSVHRKKILQYISYLKDIVPTPSAYVPVKIYCEGDIRVMKTKANVSLKKFLTKVEKVLSITHVPTVVEYEQENEKLTFSSTKELQQVLQEAKVKGETFKVWVNLF